MTFGLTWETETPDRKSALLKHIENAPGIRYRELLRLTGLSNGVLSHHLSGLEEAGLIQVHRKQTKTTRYYPVNISERETAVLSFIRHEPLRQIVLLLLEHDTCTLNDFVGFTNKAPSTISGHLKCLKESGLIAAKRKDLHILYRLVDRELITDILSKYRESFIEKSVDNFLGMFEEL